MFCGELVENCVELFGVCPAVIGWDANLGDNDFSVRSVALPDHLGKVVLRYVDGQSTQTIVTAQFYQHDGRLLFFQQPREPRKAALGGVARDARVENAVCVTMFIKTLLQKAGPRLAGFHAERGAQAVAQDDDGTPFRRLQTGWQNNKQEQQETEFETHEYP